MASPRRRLGLSSEDADPRSLLQSRLRLYHLVLFALTGALLVVSFGFVSSMETLDYDAPTTLSFLIHAGIVAVSGISWWILRGRPLRTGALHAIDAVVAGLIGLLAGGWVPLIPTHFRPELSMLLAMTQVLFCRAALVPSAAPRTASVGLAAMVPVVVAIAFAFSRGATPPWLRPAASIVGLACAWALIIIALSAITSRVIYGLRRKVEEALQLGQYTVEQLIGKGGMGTVYLARHSLLRRPTALKVLESEAAGTEAIARFELEVQTTSQLTHPNTVAIYDYGRTPDSCFYYAMEYLDGFDLDTLVGAEGPQPPARIIHVLRQVCGALAEAHERGLVHRDIKPANIMLCERGLQPDFVKVLDFGLVRSQRSAAPELSREQTVRGTPLYMAPEAILTPGEVDARADIYAIGGVAYFLLAGRPVFDGRTAMEIMMRHVHDLPEPPSLRGGRAVPDRLEALVLACLAKEPDRRPASMFELRDALDQVGVEPWTDAQARSWWSERAQLVRDLRAERDRSATAPPTIGIDLALRRPSPGAERGVVPVEAR